MEKIIPSLVSSHCMGSLNGVFCGMTVHITARNTIRHYTVSNSGSGTNFSQQS